MTVATVESYLKIYWTGLKEQLDALDTALYTDLAANAAVTITQFDTSHLTTAQLNQAQALLISIDCAGSPSLGGNSSERHFDSLKIFDRSMKKTSGLDWSIGEFCRLLKITLQEYYGKSETSRVANYVKTRISSIYMAPSLDQRGQVFKDYDLESIRDDRESYPLDNRYNSLGRTYSRRPATENTL